MNTLVDDTRAKIADYKTALESEDVTKIQLELTDLDLAVLRHSQPVRELVEALIDGETKLKDAEKDKKTARATLTAQMTQTLTKYRADINMHLSNLGALFAIDEIKTNFLGSTPRTDYGISLRGKPVKLTGGVPSFATALSEGDKRTMAFAFFVASTLGDPQLSDKIVVVDDPMSSLDKARREYTTELLLTISNKCSQLIVLAHDAVYLRDLRKAMQRQDDQKLVSTVQITRTVSSYSNFDSVDLDRECESAYYTNYRVVDDFVEGRASDERAAAVAMRPLLEGYLHRRYPGHISSDVMLGNALDQIGKAPAASPLALAKNHVSEMQALNSFAGKFHHDTNPDHASVRPDPQSVAAYGKRVLDLIHGA
jgi:wobble nucleotide-excising tRNase